jgi:hypothetical protein
MSMPLPECRVHLLNPRECQRSQLVLLDELPTHRSWGCLTCKGVTITTRSAFDQHSRELAVEQAGLAARRATERQKAWFSIHRR